MDKSQETLPLTILLEEWRKGDGKALEDVIAFAFAQLKLMAAHRVQNNAGLTISPLELLNEAVIRLMESETNFKNRAHFFATISLHMRSILVDHARARQTNKRGCGAIHITLNNDDSGEDAMTLELIALDNALNKLEKKDARAAQILHLTYFAGLDRQSIASVIEISIPTIDRELRFARAWLSEQIGYSIE